VIAGLAGARILTLTISVGMTGWKKVRDPDAASTLRICRLTIPDHAERVNVNGFWRASLAFVEAVEGAEAGVSMFDPLTVYLPGSWITPATGYDPDPATPHGGGIHFFAERARAERRWAAR
jgi:hypothetical protein